MERFNFNLATLLRYRGTLEQASLREFTRELRRLGEHEKSLSVLVCEQKRLSEEMDGLRASGDKRLELSLYTTYMADLKAFIREKEAQMAGCRKELERKRKALVEAMKDRKALDVMKERSLEEHRVAMTRLEQKALDDIAGARTYRGGQKDEN